MVGKKKKRSWRLFELLFCIKQEKKKWKHMNETDVVDLSVIFKKASEKSFETSCGPPPSIHFHPPSLHQFLSSLHHQICDQ